MARHQDDGSQAFDQEQFLAMLHGGDKPPPCMTVAQLIEALRPFPPDKPVFVAGFHASGTRLDEVVSVTVNSGSGQNAQINCGERVPDTHL